MTTNVYDAVGNRVSMTNGSGTETRVYDNLDRLTSMTRSGSGTVAYAYDPGGNVTRRTYPAGTVVDSAFDSLGRLVSVVQGTRTTAFGVRRYVNGRGGVVLQHERVDPSAYQHRNPAGAGGVARPRPG